MAKKNTTDLKKNEYTDEEKTRLAKYEQRANKKPVKFKAEESDSDKPSIALKDPDDPLMFVKLSEAMGTQDSDLQGYLLQQAIYTFKDAGGADGGKAAFSANAAFAILTGIQPQDELEGMLAIQMIGVHNMAMETLARAGYRDQTFEGKQANINQATKMLRTFMSQMEALKRYRTGGQQKMIVEHVNVNEGGQAVVGTVNQGGA